MIAFQSIPPIITIAIMESKRQRDCGHYHNRDMSTYAERLAEARKASGMTQTELARAAGLKNQSIIGSLETGYRKSTSYTPALANALGVSALWLAEGKGPRTIADASGQPQTPPSTALTAAEVSALWMALPEPRRAAIKPVSSGLFHVRNPITANPPRKISPSRLTTKIAIVIIV